MRVLKRALLVFLGLGVLGAISWIGYYGYRSSSGGYREIAHPGGVVTAVWCPVDLHVTDFPLLVVDRWFFHEPVTTVSGQGDQPRLYRISRDGKTLIPTGSEVR